MAKEKLKSFGGKVYKYYSFSDKFALSNFENDIIYFSKPENFNDPFDCYVGLSFEKTLEKGCLQLLNTDLVEEIENDGVQKNLMALLFGKTNEQENGPLEKLLTFILKDKDFIELIKLQQNGHTVSNQDMVNLFVKKSQENPIFATEFLGLITNSNIANLNYNNDNFVKTSSILFKPEILNLLIDSIPNKSSTEETNSIDDIKSFINANGIKNKIAIMQKLTGKETDAIEKIEKFEESIPKALDDFYNIINNQFCITCFAESSDNVLMWSHYADKHGGFCVEYDFNKCSDVFLINFLFKVIYEKDRPSIPLGIIDIGKNKKVTVSTRKNEWMADIMVSLLIKSDIWEYENEWRIIYPNKLTKEQKISEDIISSVYLGANASNENIGKIKQCVAKKNDARALDNSVAIYQYKLDKESYKLIREKIF